MFAVVVKFQLKEGVMDQFLPAMKENAQLSLKDEPCCHRFDVCTDPARPNEVLLYELYTDRAAFDLHLGTPHFNSFDRETAALIADKDVRTYDEVS
ncbi:antibiotic biosynthesis monooxygenase [Aliishimia ponticola]|uniref:Antibiotic biosynthesis monooxygenase n=1 Tax=Aliishimia ponticola TaxID=2499833 RepID=A0A4S4N7S7_9RHOB|nr:putative quinol monooxygenase [Aliishimia ponticola]THH35139.1 antibiotic biosynthesis monooxygenase [Aliishimia ponticola]